jgi:hypothetical protein
VDSNGTSEWKLRLERFVAGRKSRVVFVAAVAILAGCAALALGARANGTRRESANAEAERARSLASQPPSPSSSTTLVRSQALEGALVTLHPQGFEPSSITRPQGRFVLAINNRSGLREISVSLDRESGPRLRTIPMARAKRLWGEGIELPPGRYVLTEASHPKWICNITVTPK